VNAKDLADKDGNQKYIIPARSAELPGAHQQHKFREFVNSIKICAVKTDIMWKSRIKTFPH
jgi:hypothetical protein